MRPRKTNRRKPWRSVRTARRGGAVVEMAIVTPLLMMILLGTIEFGYVFMMEQSLTNAAREACRMATLPGASDADIQTRAQQALAGTGLNVTSGNVTITHATPQNPVVQVSVRVPYSEVTLLGVLPSGLMSNWFGDGGSGAIGGKTIGSTCSMHLEPTNPT